MASHFRLANLSDKCHTTLTQAWREDSDIWFIGKWKLLMDFRSLSTYVYTHATRIDVCVCECEKRTIPFSLDT